MKTHYRSGLPPPHPQCSLCPTCFKGLQCMTAFPLSPLSLPPPPPSPQPTATHRLKVLCWGSAALAVAITSSDFSILLNIIIAHRAPDR